MRNPRLNRWREPSKTEGLLLFAQRIEEMLFEEKRKSAKIAQLLEEARSVVVIKELEYEALFESEQAKTAVVQKIEYELEEARREAEQLKVQLEADSQRTEDLKRNEKNLKNLV